MVEATARRPVLITGCSSGIGRVTAEHLAARGHLVYATARQVDSIESLSKAGCRLLPLDVTAEASMVAAVSAIEDEHGAVGALVNNAGYGEYGPVEEVPMERVRREFETNVFGLARMCQLVLPKMRDAGSGRIVNVSSMGGRIVLPLGGYYHATKHAVEALSDALRMEVRPFGIHVSVIEPGMIRTDFGSTAVRTMSENADSAATETSVAETPATETPATETPTSASDARDLHRTGPYDAVAAKQESLITRNYEGRLAASPQRVAAAIEDALTAVRPKTRYVVTAHARAGITARRLLGDRGWDFMIRHGMT